MMKIFGHVLPHELQELIRQERWKRPADTTRLQMLTGSERCNDFSFLTPFGIEGESGFQHLLKDAKIADIYGLASSRQLGEPITDSEILDTDHALIIAINWDEEVIALDYRVSTENPRVMFSVWDDQRTRWRILADNFSEFATQIGI